MKDKNMYYDINKTLSRQRLFNFVIGQRGVGKTFSAKKRVLENWLKKKEQFVYIRRYDTEIPAAEMINFWDDVSPYYSDRELKSGKGLFRCDGDVIGWYFALSKATMLKSIPFPNVSLIIFDEFIIEVGLRRYLPNEVKTFLECYSTISRDRDVPVVFLSNAITMTNPYFIYFDLYLEKNQKLKLTSDISLELIESPIFEQHMKTTRFGRLVNGTDYGKYSIENQFVLDTNIFVEPLPPASHYICTIVTEGKQFGTYSTSGSNIYISESVDETFPIKIALNVQDHSPDTILALRKNFMFVSILDAFYSGCLRFTTVTSKNILLPFLKKSL